MIRLFTAMLLLAVPVFAWAKPLIAAPVENGNELTADQAVREALASNRDLQAALLEIEIARGRLLQAGRLSNPEVHLAGVDDFASRREGERAGSVGFAQSFPITARLARERDVARSEVRIAQAEVRDFVRGLIADTLGAFYTLLNLDRRIEVNDELVESVRQVEQATLRRLRAITRYTTRQQLRSRVPPRGAWGWRPRISPFSVPDAKASSPAAIAVRPA